MRRLRCCVMRKRFSPNAVQLRDDIATLSRFRFRGPLRRLIVGRLAPVAGVGKSLGDYAAVRGQFRDMAPIRSCGFVNAAPLGRS